MSVSRLLQRAACVLMSAATFAQAFAPADPANSKFPYPERLTYRVEWRAINAGNARVELLRSNPDGWTFTLNLESAGLVTRLYKIADTYRMASNDRFCANSSTLDAHEGKRRAITQLTFDNARHKLEYGEKDLVKNQEVKNLLDIPPCTYDIIGALATLRTMHLDPGKSATLPVTNGKKMAYAKVEAQAKENISVNGKPYSATRYEAFLFDNVVYKRHGRMFIWLTDDADRIPVQLRLQLGFPIGTVTVQLTGQEKL